MKYEKVTIKQIPDDGNGTAYGLSKYNRSRFPGCLDRYEPSLLPDGRYVTGLDEDGYDVFMIKDDSLREEKITDIKNTKASLEKLLRKDLSATSDFWETFYVGISTDQDLILSRFNPADILKYHVLVANGFAAPSQEYIGHPLYKDARYYCHVEEVEAQEKVSNQKLRDKARAELSKISDNKDKMLLVGKYLDSGKFKNNMLPDTLYGILSDYLDNRKEPENVDKFLKATKLPVEDLQFKISVESAIKKKIIKYKEGQYTRGGVNFGRTPLEVIQNLKLPEYAQEFISIYEELNEK